MILKFCGSILPFVYIHYFITVLAQKSDNNNELNGDDNYKIHNLNKYFDRPCIIEHDDKIFDLSVLATKDYWVYKEPHKAGNDMIFVTSLCHPVQNIPSCVNSGNCFAKISSSSYGDYSTKLLRSINFTSAGEYTNQKPEVLHGEALVFKLENGGKCKHGSSEVNYTTEIYLQCPNSAHHETAGPILMSSLPCLYIFVWMTFAACPQKVEQSSDPCIISFSNSEYPLNLHSLHSTTFYKVENMNFSYEINICGEINKGSCNGTVAICEISNDNITTVLASPGNEKIIWSNSNESLTMTYFEEEKNYSSNIHLYCDRTDFKPRIYLTSKTKNEINFIIYTINVCEPQSSDCVLQDQNLNMIDLRPLHREEGNYKVYGRKPYSEGAIFYLNVCGPLNNPEVFNCSSAPIGACLAKGSSSKSLNIGYMNSNPKVNTDGSVTILYAGGEPCSELHPTPSSTSITFVCSTVEIGPVLMSDFMFCRHSFVWYTPKACPVGLITSKDCTINDKVFGHYFDLNPLRNTVKDFELSQGNDSFLLNICGPLVASCGESPHGNTSVCHTGPSGQESGGSSDSELLFIDGTILMKFPDGANCSSGGRWSSHILIPCMHGDNILGKGPQYIYSDSMSCLHNFIWQTPVACPPYEEVECSVVDGQKRYNLSPLSSPHMNEVYLSEKEQKKYYINICRSVVHSKDARCPYDAGACLVYEQDNKPVNLGKVKSGPYIENERLKIKYENGDSCGDEKSDTYTTVIEFECSKDEFSYPVLVSEDKCSVTFKYATPYACPESVDGDTGTSVSNCTALNPRTQYLFDMSSLESQTPYELSLGVNKTLLINACGVVRDSRCTEDASGACVVLNSGKSSNAGKFNRALHFDVWTTYLEYDDGNEMCANGLKRRTRISFVCQAGHVHGNYIKAQHGPFLISNDEESCVYFIHWYTDLACERRIQCLAHSWQMTFDLSPLSKHVGNYIATDPSNPDYRFYINICRPLNPIPGMHCEPGASSCLVRGSTQPTLGLGYPILNPTVISASEVQLMQNRGSPCPTNPKFTITTKIIFRCNHTAALGNPIFDHLTEDCVYFFNWATSLVCPPPNISTQCQISLPATQATNIDLMPLRREIPYRVVFGARSFLVNLCGGSSCHDQTAVCSPDDDQSFGKSDHSDLSWDHGVLSLTYYSGSECPGAISGKRSTRIFFECDLMAGYGHPEADPIMRDVLCLAVFTWKTNLTCLHSLYSTPAVFPQPVTPPNTTTSPAPVFSTETTPFNHNGTGASIDPQNQPSKSLPTSHQTWASILISCLVVMVVVAAFVYILVRSTRGRRIYERVKRTVARRGDQIFMLDDHL